MAEDPDPTKLAPYADLRAEAHDAGVDLTGVSDEDLVTAMLTADRVAEQLGIARWAALGDLVEELRGGEEA